MENETNKDIELEINQEKATINIHRKATEKIFRNNWNQIDYIGEQHISPSKFLTSDNQENSIHFDILNEKVDFFIENDCFFDSYRIKDVKLDFNYTEEFDLENYLKFHSWKRFNKKDINFLYSYFKEKLKGHEPIDIFRVLTITFNIKNTKILTSLNSLFLDELLTDFFAKNCIFSNIKIDKLF